MVKVFTIAALLAFFISGNPASAHKVIASVFPSGSNVEGEIGFSSGDMASDTLVEVFDAEGNKIDQLYTDSDGFFVYTPTGNTDLIFRANLGSGHVAEAEFSISDLALSAKPSSGEAKASVNVSAGPDSSDAPRANEITPDQRQMISDIVRDEIRPLRREITAYKEKNDLQSILGGIGYIFGFFGIAFYIAARRLKAKATTP